jgi:hypothetical protein
MKKILLAVIVLCFSLCIQAQTKINQNQIRYLADSLGVGVKYSDSAGTKPIYLTPRQATQLFFAIGLSGELII